MKIHCNVIQDLLPLYHDEICSRETRELVELHLQSCEKCRQELQSMHNGFTAPVLHPSEKTVAEAASAAWKKGKKRAKFKGATVTALLFLFIAAILIIPYTKPGMTATVRIWEKQLTQYAQAQLESGTNSIKSYMGYHAATYPGSDCVFFEYYGNGYKGFFYTESGEPVGFQGTNAKFEKCGNGWLWKEADGDNWMYAEQIVGNWYWYEMHF